MVVAVVEVFVSEITIPDTGEIEGDLLHLYARVVEHRPGHMTTAHGDRLRARVRLPDRRRNRPTVVSAVALTACKILRHSPIERTTP